jgi:hypothetical protein
VVRRGGRAEANAAAARREALRARGGAPDLAQQLRALAEEQQAKLAAAKDAERLAEFAHEAVAARYREAAEAVVEALRQTTFDVLTGERHRELAAVARLVEAVGPLLDELVASHMSRDALSALVNIDRGPMARMLLQKLAAQADMAAAQESPALA